MPSTNKKDTGIDLQEMNVDHLFVDESHKFKNLTFHHPAHTALPV